MTGLALALTLFSALGWSGLDILRKSLSRQVEPQVLVIWLSLGLAPLFLGWVLITAESRLTPEYIVPGLISCVIGIAANVLFIKALLVSPISLTIPFLGLVPAFALLGGSFLLKEFPSITAIGGILLVVLSALALNGGRGTSNLWQAFRREPGSVLMVFVALLWALTSVMDKLCMEHADMPMHAFLQNVLIGGGLLLYRLATRKAVPLPHKRQAILLGTSLLCGLAGLGFQLIAIQHTMVSLMETVKRVTGLIASLISGRLIFQERITGFQLLSVAGMIAGVWLIFI